MEEKQAKFGIVVDTNTKHLWSIGINLTRWYRETYLYISLFKWSVTVGKFNK